MVKILAALLLVSVLVICLVLLIDETGRYNQEKPEEFPSPVPATKNPENVTEKNPEKSPGQTGSESNYAGSRQPGVNAEPGDSNTHGKRAQGGKVITGEARPPGEMEIDGKKFKLVGKHNINPGDIKLERDGKTVTARFPIPQEAKKKNDESKQSGKRKGE
jgi:hypothetical protein